MRQFSWVFILLALVPGVAWGQLVTPHTYAPGFTGQLHRIDFPLDPDESQDRQIMITIRFMSEPVGGDRQYNYAFREACFKHRRYLQDQARSYSRAKDWTVRITFDWVTQQTESATATKHKRQVLGLRTCRAKK